MSLITWSKFKSTWVISNDGLNILTDVSPFGGATTVVSIPTGKYYWEIKAMIAADCSVGVCIQTVNTETIAWNITNFYRTYRQNGQKSIGGSSGSSSYGASYANGDVIGVSVDTTNGTIEFYKNGVSQGIAFVDIIPLGNIYPFIMRASSTSSILSVETNFGASPFTYDIPFGCLPYDLVSARSNWFIITRHLIKSFNKIKTLTNNLWLDITSNISNVNSITQDEFETYGMKLIPSLDNLKRPSELLTWSDSAEPLTYEIGSTLFISGKYKIEVNTDYFDGDTLPLQNVISNLPKSAFIMGDNILKISLSDSFDTTITTTFEYNIIMEDRDTFTLVRRLQHDTSPTLTENLELKVGDGLSVISGETGSVTLSLPTDGKSKLESITVDLSGTEELIVTVSADMTFIRNELDGKVYEYTIDLTKYKELLSILVEVD